MTSAKGTSVVSQPEIVERDRQADQAQEHAESSCAPWLAAAAVVMIGGAFVLRWIVKGVLF
jgi:hypothetical protein